MTKLKLRPLAGYCLIEPLTEEQEKTSSGLILPEEAKEKPAKGRVLAVGPPLSRFEAGMLPNEKREDGIHIAGENPQVNVNEVIVFHRWSGQDIKEGEKEYKLVKFSDLMGVYE